MSNTVRSCTRFHRKKLDAASAMLSGSSRLVKVLWNQLVSLLQGHSPERPDGRCLLVRIDSGDEKRPKTVVRRDWTVFYETGQRFVVGNLGSIYPWKFDQGYLWLYPPYCIYLTAPLGLVPEPAAYALCFLVQAAAVAVALALIRASVP